MVKDVTINLIRRADECINNGIPLIMHIFPCDGDHEGDLPYSYTVGMHNLGYPELIMRLARVYYEEKGKDFKEMEILQVMWPDKNGKFPESSIDYTHQINFPLTQ